MSKFKFLKRKRPIRKISQCYNCGIEITTTLLKRCPSCKIILDPNNYINWRKSFYGFLCFLCLIPILITILFIIAHF